MAESRQSKNTTDGKVDISKLLREGATEQDVLYRLREAYPNDKDLVNKLFSEYEDQMTKIKRKARKFAELILTRYNHLGPKRIFEKAKKLQKKYNFSDDEFAAFQQIAFSDKALSAINIYNSPNTPMSRTLGQLPDSIMGKMSVKTSELDVLQEVLKMAQETSVLHNQVVIQSLTYQDCSKEALSGAYDPTRHNPLTFVHPVVAALFVPRIPYLDEHMLIASIPNIVAGRHNNQTIKDRPSYELFWDMITDPNETACVDSKDSPMVDLRNRSKVQVELWKAVKNLRQGKYFDPEAANFMVALDNCRSNIFDTADNLLVKDEGAILRRLMGAFSLRPTIVSVSPNIGYQAQMNYPLNTMGITQVTTIPIVNMRLPYNTPTGASMGVDLRSADTQLDWYVDNKMIVSKNKQVIHSRALIIYYVNRRFQNVNLQRLAAPYSFHMLPLSTTGFETLNSTVVNYQNAIVVGTDTFDIKSIVMVDKAAGVLADPARTQSGVNQDLIIGCTAGIVCVNVDVPNYVMYNPLAVSINIVKPAPTGPGASSATFSPIGPTEGVGALPAQAVIAPPPVASAVAPATAAAPETAIGGARGAQRGGGDKPVTITDAATFQVRASSTGSIFVYVKRN